MYGRRSIAALSVLCFYLIYALLPLLYCVDAADLETPLPVCTDASEYLQDPSSAQHLVEFRQALRQDPSASAAPYVMLRKKRVSASSFFRVLPPSSVPFTILPPSAHDVLSTALTIDDRLQCPNGFRFYHSGSSPPFA